MGLQDMLKQIKERRAFIKAEDNLLQKMETDYTSFLNGYENSAVDASSKPARTGEYPDYPMSGTLQQKMEYFDKISPRGWRGKPREQLIRKIEGEQAGQTLKYFSQQVKALVNAKVYIRGKYNNCNRYSIYYKPEWLDIGEKTNIIKPGFSPEEEHIADIEMHKRKIDKISWSNFEEESSSTNDNSSASV